MANEEYKNPRELQQFLLHFFLISLGCIYPKSKTKYKRLHLKKTKTENAKRLETTLKSVFFDLEYTPAIRNLFSASNWKVRI